MSGSGTLAGAAEMEFRAFGWRATGAFLGCSNDGGVRPDGPSQDVLEPLILMYLLALGPGVDGTGECRLQDVRGPMSGVRSLSTLKCEAPRRVLASGVVGGGEGEGDTERQNVSGEFWSQSR